MNTENNQSPTVDVPVIWELPKDLIDALNAIAMIVDDGKRTYFLLHGFQHVERETYKLIELKDLPDDIINETRKRLPKESKVSYPFEFNELLLTDKVLDVLGFSEYWAGSGEFGDRRLDLGGQVGDERHTSKNEYPSYFIYEIDETEDPAGGYGGEPEYSSCHFTTKDFERFYFLHEMYEDILKRRTPEEVERFIEITKQKGVNMYPYIKSWIEFKEKQ